MYDLQQVIQKVFQNVMFLCEQQDITGLAVDPNNLLPNVLSLFSYSYLGWYASVHINTSLTCYSDQSDIPIRRSRAASVGMY